MAFEEHSTLHKETTIIPQHFKLHVLSLSPHPRTLASTPEEVPARRSTHTKKDLPEEVSARRSTRPKKHPPNKVSTQRSTRPKKYPQSPVYEGCMSTVQFYSLSAEYADKMPEDHSQNIISSLYCSWVAWVVVLAHDVVVPFPPFLRRN